MPSTNSFNNTAVGSRALWSQVDGNDNVAVGTDALRSNNSVQNTAVGVLAGAENLGYGNMFLGYAAGQNELGNNKLYIANSNTASPLILGDFLTKKITINDSLQSKYFRLPTGASNDFILKSDANGNASWVNPTIIANGNWTTSGTNQYAALSGNVGIGTNTPSEKLEIVGKIKTTNFQLTNGATDNYILDVPVF